MVVEYFMFIMTFLLLMHLSQRACVVPWLLCDCVNEILIKRLRMRHASRRMAIKFNALTSTKWHNAFVENYLN